MNGSQPVVQIYTDGTGIPSPGTAPTVALSATSLTFGSQTVNAVGAPQTVTITNTGSAPLNITGINSNSIDDFDFLNTCGASTFVIGSSPLAVGSSCAITVQFHPMATGTRLGSISITDNATNSPLTISLTGTGVGTPGVTLGNQPYMERGRGGTQRSPDCNLNQHWNGGAQYHRRYYLRRE